jgi:hypothetical protein
LAEIDDAVSVMQGAMEEASQSILGGFVVRTEAKVFTDRFEDPRGESTWRLVCELLERCRPEQEQGSLWGTAGLRTVYNAEGGAQCTT